VEAAFESFLLAFREASNMQDRAWSEWWYACIHDWGRSAVSMIAIFRYSGRETSHRAVQGVRFTAMARLEVVSPSRNSNDDFPTVDDGGSS
jgi:hypothetical protein